MRAVELRGCHAQGANPINDTTRAAARVQAERVVRLAAAFKEGSRRLTE